MSEELKPTDADREIAIKAQRHCDKHGQIGGGPITYAAMFARLDAAHPVPTGDAVETMAIRICNAMWENDGEDWSHADTAQREEFRRVAKAALQPEPSGGAVDWRRLAINMAVREADYRLNHDVHGDGSMDAGRAWDRMRQAGDAIRDIVLGSGDAALQSEPPDGLADTALDAVEIVKAALEKHFDSEHPTVLLNDERQEIAEVAARALSAQDNLREAFYAGWIARDNTDDVTQPTRCNEAYELFACSLSDRNALAHIEATKRGERSHEPSE